MHLQCSVCSVSSIFLQLFMFVIITKREKVSVLTYNVESVVEYSWWMGWHLTLVRARIRSLYCGEPELPVIRALEMETLTSVWDVRDEAVGEQFEIILLIPFHPRNLGKTNRNINISQGTDMVFLHALLMFLLHPSQFPIAKSPQVLVFLTNPFAISFPLL